MYCYCGVALYVYIMLCLPSADQNGINNRGGTIITWRREQDPDSAILFFGLSSAADTALRRCLNHHRLALWRPGPFFGGLFFIEDLPR